MISALAAAEVAVGKGNYLFMLPWPPAEYQPYVIGHSQIYQASRDLFKTKKGDPVKVAINFPHIGAALKRETVDLTGDSQCKAQHLLNKRSSDFGPDHSLVELKGHKSDSSSLSEHIQLAQQGDARAFEIIYQRHCRRVYALCLRMLRDPVEAEDSVQEVFLQLFRKIHTFRGDSAFSTWLHRLTANLVLMRLRKKKPILTSLDEISESAEEEGGPHNEIGRPDQRMTGLIDRINLQRAIEQLPAGFKVMFILHDVQGYQHGEIAEILGCSVGNSKSQLHKARNDTRASAA